MKGLSTYRIPTWLLLLALVSTVSCDKPNAPDCFQKAGEIISIERSFDSPITALELHDFVHVTLVPSDENKVIVRGPENLLPEVITDLTDGVLLIDDENGCDFVRRLDIQPRVTILANVESILNFSQGNIESFGAITSDRFEMDSWQASGTINLELDCDSVFFRTHTGVSTSTLSGSSNYLYVYHLGFGPVDAMALLSAKTSVRSNSINDIAVFAQDKLVAWIEGSGNITYSGEPGEVVVIQDGNGLVLQE